MASNRSSKLVALFLLALAMFNVPILHLFWKIGWLWGMPAIYFYLFVAWLAIIVLIGNIAAKDK